ncbi:response regulator [Paenibacillus sp. OAS669]|uniref:response regulator n=1 Tax=Paenibacillus sp. OAS669 TaxID=2663821 RepID=UPI001789A7AE|nr:response regulator [Paenibacillus sp. OAS669]MBE1445122.1 YesN/AraC family two-component response regulator [Paenibacillus sp. OAS669]
MRTVLLVEDEVFVRESVRRIIDWEKLGFTVIGEAGDGEEALSLIREHKPDVVISDIIMPRLNGVELLKQVREEGNDARFIMLSCMSDFDYVRQAMEYGASNYILKLSMKVQSLYEALEKVEHELNIRSRREAYRTPNAPEKTCVLTDHPEMNKILTYLHERYHEDISLGTLAQFVAMDLKYVSQLFKKKTGDTFVHYLHRLRIEQAQKLLETTRMPISEVGEKVGFLNDNYFIKIFRRFCHMTPQNYRKLKQQSREME